MHPLVLVGAAVVAAGVALGLINESKEKAAKPPKVEEPVEEKSPAKPESKPNAEANPDEHTNGTGDSPDSGDLPTAETPADPGNDSIGLDS